MNLSWGIAIIIVAIYLLGKYGLRILDFLFKHKIKGKYLDGYCKPEVVFKDDKSKTLTLHQYGSLPSDAQIGQLAQNEVQKVEAKYPLQNLDAYMNPFLYVGDNMYEAQQRNSKIELYIKSLKGYKFNTRKTEELLKRFEPVHLCVINRGSKACGEMIVKISVETGGSFVFDSDKMTYKKGNVYDESIINQKNSRSIIISPGLYPHKEYDYVEENPQAMPIGERALEYTFSGLLQTRTIDLTTLYVDTAQRNKIVISWTIIESSLGKNGTSGKLKITTK